VSIDIQQTTIHKLATLNLDIKNTQGILFAKPITYFCPLSTIQLHVKPKQHQPQKVADHGASSYKVEI
jgi:hypothetical protein